MPDWETVFCGRENELSALKDAWKQVSDPDNPSPQTRVIVAERGLGKTRLVQEFYRWLSTHHDGTGNQGYWPDQLQTADKLRINPDFTNYQANGDPTLPFLWWGLGFPEPGNGEGLVLAYSLQVIEPHLLQMKLAREARGIIKEVASKAGEAAVNVAASVTGLDAAKELVFTAFEIGKIIKETNDHHKEDAAAFNFDEAFQKQQNSLKDRVLHDLRILLDPKIKDMKTVPMVLVIENAQWALHDQTSMAVISAITDDAHERSWPLMIIATHHEDEWRKQWSSDRTGDNKKISFANMLHSANGPLKHWFHGHDETTCKAHDPLDDSPVFIHLNEASGLEEMILTALPGLTDAQVDLIANRAGGNPLMASELIRLVTNDDLLFEDMDFTNPLNEDGVDLINKQTGKIHELVKKRFSQLPSEVRKVLGLSASQGMRFSRSLSLHLSKTVGRLEDPHSPLMEGHNPHSFTTSSDNPEIEFNQRVHHDVAHSFITERKTFADSTQKEIRSFIINHVLSGDAYEGEEALLLLHLSASILKRSPQLDTQGAYLQTLIKLIDHYTSTYDIIKSNEYGLELQKQLELGSMTLTRSEANSAWNLLVRSAYLEGDVEREAELLNTWEKILPSKTYEFFQSAAFHHIRNCAPQKGASYAGRAVDMAKSDTSLVYALATQAYALWSNGDPHKALDILSKAEEKLYKLNDNVSVGEAIDHTASVVLHDLELNYQAAMRAKTSSLSHKASEALQDELFSIVNYADALWGLGRSIEAEKILSTACSRSREANLPHALDISLICLGNVRADQGEREDALLLYDEGIKLASSINHHWDLLYGKAYQLVCSDEVHGNVSALEALEIAEEAKQAGYYYIQALSSAVASIIALNSDPDGFDQIEKYLDENPSLTRFPIFQLYYNAVRILLSDSLSAVASISFLNVLGLCEGVKLRKKIIFKAIRRILNDGHLNEIHTHFANRWISRFSQSSLEIGDDTLRIKECDYKSCEARCCYDGVYLDQGDIEKLHKAVSNNSSFFNFLPENYIVEGEWDGVKGEKTGVKPYTYISPDFPSHFNHTRCVFALKDGACSLQKLAITQGMDSWAYKPSGCWMHPLRISDENEKRLLSPPHFLEADPDSLGLKYPGYISFTPCGQHCSDGDSWQVVLQEEIGAARKVFNCIE